MPFNKIFENLPMFEILNYSEKARNGDIARLDFLEFCDEALGKRLNRQSIPSWNKLLGLRECQND